MDAIDIVLLDWFEWSQSYEPALGYGKVDAACRDFRISRQWMDYDDLDAEVERNLKERTGKVVEPMIQKLDLRLRLAVNAAMRKFQVGYSVWFLTGQALEYEEAKELLRPKLVAANLIDRAIVPNILVNPI